MLFEECAIFSGQWVRMRHRQGGRCKSRVHPPGRQSGASWVWGMASRRPPGLCRARMTALRGTWIPYLLRWMARSSRCALICPGANLVHSRHVTRKPVIAQRDSSKMLYIRHTKKEHCNLPRGDQSFWYCRGQGPVLLETLRAITPSVLASFSRLICKRPYQNEHSDGQISFAGGSRKAISSLECRE